MITRDSIETAYSFLHQKQNVYVHSQLEWQRDDIEYAVASYADDMNPDLYNLIAAGRQDFLREHSRFAQDIALAVERMERMLDTTTERFTADIDTQSYIKRFRNADYFITFCQQCGNYGRRYGCPPFDYNPLTIIESYERIRIIGVKITPHDIGLPLSLAGELMEPVIASLNKELLEMEKHLDGFCCGFVGSCPYCKGESCARIEGKPCKHPDKVRPSLEAFGFDMSLTAKELLGLDIKWSKGNTLPEYITLLCGIFYQKKPSP